MSEQSNKNGRAYEYISLLVLYDEISKKRPVKIIQNSSLLSAKRAWDGLDDDEKNILKKSAEAAVRTLFDLEKLLVEDANDDMNLVIQSDRKGVDGDVRDILIIRSEIEWEIGLSIKHNHFAVKHSRIAKGLDFGSKWFGVECSEKYWGEVKLIFDYLEKEKAKGTKWSDLPNKNDVVYLPLLDAFVNELERSYKNNPDLPKRMVEYLIGKYDFYKVISLDREKLTQIQAVNIRGDLNKPSRTEAPAISIPKTALPTEIITIRIRPDSFNTAEVYLDKGWQFSFRIHNASTIVEPSLKFDIQLEGIPSTIMSINSYWD